MYYREHALLFFPTDVITTFLVGVCVSCTFPKHACYSYIDSLAIDTVKVLASRRNWVLKRRYNVEREKDKRNKRRRAKKRLKGKEMDERVCVKIKEKCRIVIVNDDFTPPASLHSGVRRAWTSVNTIFMAVLCVSHRFSSFLYGRTSLPAIGSCDVVFWSSWVLPQSCQCWRYILERGCLGFVIRVSIFARFFFLRFPVSVSGFSVLISFFSFFPSFLENRNLKSTWKLSDDADSRNEFVFYIDYNSWTSYAMGPLPQIKNITYLKVKWRYELWMIVRVFYWLSTTFFKYFLICHNY